MLLARYAPVGSQRYKKLTQIAQSFDNIMKWFPVQLFGIWTIFVAGMASGKAQTDRYYFWDWNDWLIGIIGIIIITLLFSPLRNKFKIKELNEINWIKNSKDSLFYLLIGIVLFCLGWLLVSQFDLRSLWYSFLGYWAFLSAVLLVYSMKVENNFIFDVKAKNINTIVAILFHLAAISIGFIEDDPVVTTTAIVSLPFLIVLLFGKHIRHLERAKFYPIFIFAMFVVSREAWFLIPLLLLFFILRSYNYLRYQRVYPTFGVTTDDQS